MNANHEAMKPTVAKLEKKGFRWNHQDSESVYLSKKTTRYSTFYAQVDCYDGKTVTVNGMSLEDFLASL